MLWLTSSEPNEAGPLQTTNALEGEVGGCHFTASCGTPEINTRGASYAEHDTYKYITILAVLNGKSKYITYNV